MRGPLGKGHAEMAVSRQKGSGPETPDQTPNTEKFFMEDFENQGAEVRAGSAACRNISVH